MKRQFISWGLMLAASFTLTNCAQEIENPSDVSSMGVPFEIVANSVDTKTNNIDAVVNWTADDALNVFHAPSGTTGYVNDKNFTITEDALAEGRFKGTLTEALASGSYDWYAFYPYSSYITTPANTSSGYMVVGSKAGASQIQDGYDNMNHIAGENYPLYGVSRNVSAGDMPSFEMHHTYSIAKIVVTNKTDNDLTVNSISFTAPENLVGTYYIDFSGESLAFTGSGDKYVAKIADLKVENGTALAKNATATFYLALVPFTATSGSELKIAVNGYAKTITLPNDVTFSAGKIKTLNFAYNKEETDEDYSGEYLITGTKSNKVYAASAYGTGNNLGTVVEIAISENTITEVDGLAACKMTFSKVLEGTYAGLYTIKDSKNQYLFAASSSSNHLKGSTTLSANSYWDVIKDSNGTYSIKASKSSNRNVMQFNESNSLFSCYASASQSPITLYPYSMVVPDMTPRIKVIDTEKEISADGGQVTFEYTLHNLDGYSVDAEVSNPEMMSVTVSGGVVTVVVEKNESEERNATITLTCGDAEPVVLNVSQLGAPVSGGDVVAGAAYSYTFSSSQFSANGSKTLDGLSWTIAGDGGYWGYDSTKGQQLGSGSKPYKSLTMSTTGYSGGVSKIVINTSGASSINASLTVTVGGVQYGSTTKLTTSATYYTFEAPDAGMQVGEIKLTYTQTSSKAIYIKSISINSAN